MQRRLQIEKKKNQMRSLNHISRSPSTPQSY
jgi:hypothetical protein